MNGIPLQSSCTVVPSLDTLQSGILKLSFVMMLSPAFPKLPEESSMSGTTPPRVFLVKSAYTSPESGAAAVRLPKL